jgi:membrane-bound inhibitor of C-type lysozyme/uncharacterized lipoprotein YbaY
MKRLLLISSLMISASALAQTHFNVTFRCGSGETFQVSSTGQDQVLVQRGLFQPVEGPTRLTLPQVVSASGAKYSNGDYSVWLKGDTAILLKGETLLAQDCTASRDAEPLTPIRDASSGIVFIPPERWLAQDVKLSAKAGKEIPGYGNSASHQIEYIYQDAQGQRAALLTLLVFPSTELATLQRPPNSIDLGSDSQRVYFAQIATDNAFDPASAAGKQFAALRTNPDEVRQAFSMYGIVINQAVETLSVKVSWLDRALRPGSEQVIELYVQENDKLGELVAKQSLRLEKGHPRSATLRFDPAAINPKRHYVLIAKLLQGGRIVMNSEPQAVLTQGNGREATLLLKAKR